MAVLSQSHSLRYPSHSHSFDFELTIKLKRMELQYTADTTTLSYWFNWRVLLCTIWLMTNVIIALSLIWKYEGSNSFQYGRGETQQDITGFGPDDQTWRPCLKDVHPIWLLAFRLTALSLLFATVIVKFLHNGGEMFFYYTQWTLIIDIIYFGFGTLLSIYGSYKYHKISSRNVNVQVEEDAEQGSYVPLTYGENTNTYGEVLNSKKEKYPSRAAGVWTRCFQVIFQMTAGAVMLTDCIYWFIIFPFLTIKDYDFSFMTVNTHTLNAALLLGDTCLNSLPFPLFRISYFVLFTSVYVISQWIIHACASIWWPYPFLDLSSEYAPLWYFLVGLTHIPCYGLFGLILRIKHKLFSKWWPQSYQSLSWEYNGVD